MTVHTPDYPLLRSFFSFLSSSWSRPVDYDITSPEEIANGERSEPYYPFSHGASNFDSGA